ncbi:ngg1p interacting factor 3 protein [Apiospora phragmitis]|uniref:Ngg1p interacting factor 3 protein n=1 Tax=Apiospora phragmitis TaxID=2905665 RepID=A0ABR1TXQ0_9PEZI
MAAPTFTDAVVKAMKTLYPPELADSAWDNTGLLLDQALLPEGTESKQSEGAVLLTNDLTAAVVDEALEKQVNIIVSYHPVIFRALKSLSNQDPMQKHLLRLIAARVAVYCPHTAVDAARGGLNDWLCDIILSETKEAERKVVQPISRPLPESLQGLGYGRTMKLQGPMPLTTILKNLSRGLGDQQHIVLKDADAELIVTGEMDHHSALRYTQLGQTVVTVFHSNSERQYLTQVLKPELEQMLSQSSRAEGRVLVSQADRDPFETIDISSLGS